MKVTPVATPPAPPAVGVPKVPKPAYGKPGYGKPATANTDPVELVEQTGDFQEALIVAPYGIHGSGKSRIGATGPGAVGAVPLDRKAKQTIIDTCKQWDKRLFLPNVDLVRAPNPMAMVSLPSYCKKKPDGEANDREMLAVSKEMNIFAAQPLCCSIHHYRWRVQRVKHTLVQMAAHPDIKTIIIDSCTNLWDDILFANHGRTHRINPMDRQPDNREMQEILGICYGKHLVLTHKEADVWRNNKKTGEVEWKGYGHLGYEVGAILHMTRDKKTGVFAVDFEMCQANAAMHGDAGDHAQTQLVDDAINFQNIAMLIYPESKEEDWL